MSTAARHLTHSGRRRLPPDAPLDDRLAEAADYPPQVAVEIFPDDDRFGADFVEVGGQRWPVVQASCGRRWANKPGTLGACCTCASCCEERGR